MSFYTQSQRQLQSKRERQSQIQIKAENSFETGFPAFSACNLLCVTQTWNLFELPESSLAVVSSARRVHQFALQIVQSVSIAVRSISLFEGETS